MVDLDDSSGCPQGEACASCGSGDELGVATAETPVGVFCLTLCAGCAGAGRMPPLYPARAVALSLEHCSHLGVTADQMSDLIRNEEAS